MMNATMIRTHAHTPLPTHNIEYWKAMHLLHIGESTPRLLMTAVNQYPCVELLHEVVSHACTTTEVLERVVSTVEACLAENGAHAHTPTYQWVEVLEAVIGRQEVCTVVLASKARKLIECCES